MPASVRAPGAEPGESGAWRLVRAGVAVSLRGAAGRAWGWHRAAQPDLPWGGRHAQDGQGESVPLARTLAVCALGWLWGLLCLAGGDLQVLDLVETGLDLERHGYARVIHIRLAGLHGVLAGREEEGGGVRVAGIRRAIDHIGLGRADDVGAFLD